MRHRKLHGKPLVLCGINKETLFEWPWRFYLIDIGMLCKKARMSSIDIERARQILSNPVSRSAYPMKKMSPVGFCVLTVRLDKMKTCCGIWTVFCDNGRLEVGTENSCGESRNYRPPPNTIVALSSKQGQLSKDGLADALS